MGTAPSPTDVEDLVAKALHRLFEEHGRAATASEVEVEHREQDAGDHLVECRGVCLALDGGRYRYSLSGHTILFGLETVLGRENAYLLRVRVR